MKCSLIRSAVVIAVVGATLGLAQAVRAEDVKPAAKAAQKTGEKHLQGKIEAVDATAGTISIKQKDATKVFTAAADCTFTGEGKKALKLADLHVGEFVIVHYTEDGDKLTAHRVAYVAWQKKGEMRTEKKAE